jgi:drug/metabolite transporter (DMT)-like permease
MVAIPCGATAVLFIKASAIPPLWFAALRLLVATIAILPLAWRDGRARGEHLHAEDWRLAVLPGLMLCLHFWLWNAGSRMTSAADATLIGNIGPITLPCVAFLMFRELPNRREVAATVIGIAGVCIMTAIAFQAGPTANGRHSSAVGDLLCLGCVIAAAFYLMLARSRRRGRLWLYLVPVYGIASLSSAALGLAVEGVGWMRSVDGWRELWILLGVGLIPTVISHSIFNRAMSELRPTTVGLAGLLQCPFAAVVAWLLWSERPSFGFWFATAGVLGAFAVLCYPLVRASVATRLGPPRAAA